MIAGYRLVGKLGAGSMGTVYKARQLSLDREVAIKLLSPHLARKKDYVERFLREARAVAKLNHPNVISGIDAGEEEGVRYFVMEYASGMTVGELLQRGGAMDEARVLRVALQIARALEHAHDAGLVHRDVKPDNILLTKDHVAKLCDLGLAKDSPEEGRALGTPAYISPEQAQGLADVDIRSDLYSFGCTLYHMLTGKQPFDGNAKVVMVKHLTEEAQSIRAIEPPPAPTVCTSTVGVRAGSPSISMSGRVGTPPSQSGRRWTSRPSSRLPTADSLRLLSSARIFSSSHFASSYVGR